MAAQRKTRRGKMLVEKQEWFGRLIAQGVGPCRRAGSWESTAGQGHAGAMGAQSGTVPASRCTIHR